MAGKQIPCEISEAVYARDGVCLSCARPDARQVHHRVRRRDGRHRLSVCIWLCLWCHGDVHANPAQSRMRGMIVPTWADPLVIPVKTIWGWRLLDDNAHYTLLQPAEALPIIEQEGLMF